LNKRLNEMDDLRDMGRFPLPIYLGATGNILLTVALTHIVKGRYPRPLTLPLWAGIIISLNVLPVFLLRFRMDENTRYPEIEEMSFFTDQHKFSNWVYAVASANMLFWIVLAWTLFTYRRDKKALAGMLLLAFVSTLFPAWIRLFERSG
jgi:hypothetical protein